jgi:hypothetical protein
MYEEMTRPFRQMQELTESSLHREYKRYLDQQQSIRDMMRPFVGDINTMRAITADLGIRPALTFIEDHRKTLRDFGIPLDLKQAVDTLRSGYDRTMFMPRNINAMLRDLAPYAAAPPLTPSPEVLDAVGRRVRELRDAPGETVSERLTEFMTWVLANARRLGKSTVSFIIFVIIYPLLLSIYQPDIQKIARPYDKAALREAERQTIQAVTERVPAEALRHLRYVSTEILNVRSAPRKDSRRLFELHMGDVVLVGRQKRHWTYVEYHVGEAQIKGWVFTRYLRRFPSG